MKVSMQEDGFNFKESRGRPPKMSQAEKTNK